MNELAQAKIRIQNKQPLPTLDQATRQICINRLALYDGNKSLTAKSLGISRSTFYRWLEYWEVIVK